MQLKTFATAFAMALLMSANCAAVTQTEIEIKLIGPWQIGLNKYTKLMDEKEAFKTGLLTSIFKFNPDNSFSMYQACGMENQSVYSKFPNPLSGKWKIENNLLNIYLSLDNESSVNTYEISFENEMLYLKSDRIMKLGRYEKELPPKCN